MKSISAVVALCAVLGPLTHAGAQHCPTPDAPGAGDNAMGVGLVRPVVEAGRVLYLYGAPGDDVTVPTDAPADSVAFAETSYGTDIGYAPPWFYPEIVKLDYNLFYLRARTLRRHWVEVVVNKTDGRTAWIRRDDVAFVSWPEFIVTAFAVERTAPRENPMKARPFGYSDAVAGERGGATSGDVERDILEPLAVRGHWLKVRYHTVFEDKPDDPTVTGWIIWRDADQLCVTYSLLS